MTLAHRLKTLRDHSGLSCRELAKLIGSSPAYPSLLESGEREHIGSGFAREIARVYGTTIDHLVSGTGKAPTAKAVQEAVARARAAYAKENKTPSGAPQAPTRKAV